MYRSDSTSIMTERNRLWNEHEFMCDRVDYEEDIENGRCYRLVPSTNLRPEMDGALVKQRISRKEFEIYRAKCIEAIERHEKFMASLPALKEKES